MFDVLEHPGCFDPQPHLAPYFEDCGVGLCGHGCAAKRWQAFGLQKLGLLVGEKQRFQSDLFTYLVHYGSLL